MLLFAAYVRDPARSRSGLHPDDNEIVTAVLASIDYFIAMVAQFFLGHFSSPDRRFRLCLSLTGT
jgi:hypothetical protein